MSSQSRKELAEAGRRKLEAFRAAKKQQQQPKLVEQAAGRNDEVYAAPAPAPAVPAPERSPSLPPAAPVEPAAAWSANQHSSYVASQAPGGVFPPGPFAAGDSAADFFESLASGGSQAGPVAAPGPAGVSAPASASAAADPYAPVEYQSDYYNGYQQGQPDQQQQQAAWSAYGNGDYGQTTAVDPASYDGQQGQGASTAGYQYTQPDASAASAADSSSQVAPAYQYDGYGTGAGAYAYPANGDYSGYQNPAASTAVDPYAGHGTGYPQDPYATDSTAYGQAPYTGYGDYSATPEAAASSQWSDPQAAPGSQAAAPEPYTGQQGYVAGYSYGGSDASYYQTGSYQAAAPAPAAEPSRYSQPSASQPSYSYSYDPSPAAVPQYSAPASDGVGFAAPATATSYASDPAAPASASAPPPHPEPAPAPAAAAGVPPAAAQPKSSFMSFLRDLPAAATSALTAAGAPFQPLQYRPPPSFGSPEPPKPKEEEAASPGAAHRMADQRRNEQDAEIIRRLRGGGAGADASRGPSPPPPSAPPSARPRASQDEGQWERSEGGVGAGGMNSNPSSSGQLWGDHRQASAPSGDFSSLQQHILDLEEKQLELRREADLQGRLVQQLTRENADMMEDLNRQSNVVSDLSSEIGSLKEQLAAQGLALAAAAAERDEARGALRETGSRCRDLASEVIGLEEQVRRLKSDAYRAQSRTAEAEAALSGARAEADERLTEALKTVEFLKEQVDIQQRAYEQKLATLTGTGSGGSHQEYLLRQEVASLECRVKEAEQSSEMQLLAVTSAKDSEISQLRARLLEAERAASQAADEAAAAHAALMQNEVKLRSAESAAQARNLSEDPVLGAVADFLRPILAPPKVNGKGPSAPPPRPTAADVSAAVSSALEASKLAKAAVLPGEVLAALPTHGALLGDALKQLGQDSESTSLPFDAAQRLGDSASASIESIFRLVAELEDEREALVSALERGKRERDRLREELRAATGEGSGRARAAMQPPTAGSRPVGPGAEAGQQASTTSPVGMNGVSSAESAKEQPKKPQPPAAAPGTYFFTPAAAAPQQAARSAAPAPPPTPPRYDHGLVDTVTRSAPATPARPPGADAASQPEAATKAQQHAAAAKGRTRWFFGII